MKFLFDKLFYARFYLKCHFCKQKYWITNNKYCVCTKQQSKTSEVGIPTGIYRIISFEVEILSVDLTIKKEMNGDIEALF